MTSQTLSVLLQPLESVTVQNVTELRSARRTFMRGSKDFLLRMVTFFVEYLLWAG